MPTDITETILAIGRIDDIEQLKLVDQAVAERFRQLHERITHERAAAVRVSDRVELSGTSPKHLNGITGVVTALPGENRVEHPELIINRRYARADGTTLVDAGAVVVIAEADQRTADDAGSEAQHG